MQMNARRLLTTTLPACALAAVAAACGSSGSSTSSSSPAAKAPSASAASGSAAQAQIKAHWVAFFSPRTPAGRRVSLLQDGQELAPVIRSQAGSGLAAQASAKVTRVTLVSARQARVTYTVLESGRPVLANQTGVAVWQDGTWKVGVASFCRLLALENGGKTSALPAPCKAAG
jgi:hypothetical protein